MQGMIEEEDSEVFFDDDPQMVADEPSTSTPNDVNDANDALEAALEVARRAPTPSKPTPAVTKPTPRPMVARTSPSKEDGGGWLTWALVGAGAVVLLVGGAFVARRRGASGDDDQDWDDDAPDSYADEDTAVVAVDDNPFSGLTDDGEQTVLGMSGDTSGNTAASTGMMNDGDATMVSLPDEEKESESVVFDDAEETVMDDMEVISREQVNESLGGAMPPAAGAAIPEEFQQMVAEMNRRMESLESRCDELVDARDRLERQVAAQTEELRVQRAAIARTQRAVRNLGRPEEEQQEATEPALRDPNRPGSE